jgi:hypothetical protein
MTHAEAQQILLEWADVLTVDRSAWPDDPDRPDPTDNYTVMAGFDSEGPIILMVAARQGNVLQWCL